MAEDLTQGFRLGVWQIKPLEGVCSGPKTTRITPKAMDVLLCLAGRAGEVVERDALVKAVWGQRAVSDEPLTRCIGELRQALSDSRAAPRYIQTVPKRGYRLLVPVTVREKEAPPRAGRAATNATRNVGRLAFAAVAIGIALLAGVGVLFLGQDDDETPAVGGETAATRAAVAVLPFANLSGNPDAEHLSDGLAETLTHVLARVEGLKVVARTSAFAFKDTAEDVRTIGEKLGVDFLLEGSVQRDGETLRITTQLVNARDGTQLWSEAFDRPTDNVFAIQDEIAAAVAGELQISLVGDPVQSALGGTRNFEAYNAYLLGRQLINRRTTESLSDAAKHFEQAIVLDGDYALAYVGLADAYMLLNWYGNVSRAEMRAKVEPALERALAIDPELGEAHASQGLMHAKFDRYQEAEIALQRAIRLNPNYAAAYFWYGTIFNDSGRPQQALRMHTAARELDPLSPVINTAIAVAHEKLGDFDRALEHYQEVLEVFPDYAAAKDRNAGLYWSAFGQFDKAVDLQRDAVETDASYSASPAGLAMILMDLGLESKAEQWVEYALRIGGQVAWPLRARCMLLAYRNADAELRARAAVDASSELTTAQRLDTVVRIARDAYMDLGEPDRALALYELHYPDLFAEAAVEVDFNNLGAVIDLAGLLGTLGDSRKADRLLVAAEEYARTLPRLGYFGSGIADVEIHAIRGDTERALESLERAVDEGWRMHWWWETERNPNLTTLANTPRYSAVTARLRRETTAAGLLVDDESRLSPPN